MIVRTETPRLVRVTISCVASCWRLPPAPAHRTRSSRWRTLVPQGSAWHTTLQEMGAGVAGGLRRQGHAAPLPGRGGGRRRRRGAQDAPRHPRRRRAHRRRGSPTSTARSSPSSSRWRYAGLRRVRRRPRRKIRPSSRRSTPTRGSSSSTGRTPAGCTSSPSRRCATPDDLKALKLFTWAGDDRGGGAVEGGRLQPGAAALDGDLDGAADRPVQRPCRPPRRPRCCCSGTTRPST